MSSKNTLRAFFAVGALAVASATLGGCVADHPSRNGVFNENQYLRKDFLVRPGDSTQPDQGWFVKATIETASEPNVFGDASYFGLYAGSHSSGALVHFDITNDKMSMVNSREISTSPTAGAATGRQPEVINAWNATNVDLKYRVNLDGEKTNFYEENQELDWQERQWVKVLLDKNDMSDLAPLGQYYNAAVAKCVDESNASATLQTNSFVVDEANDYMEWAVQVTLPVKFDDADCMTAMGVNGQTAQRLGREYETVTIRYSFMRANPTPTYQPLVLDEHDAIRRKYGVITFASVDTDADTGLLAAKEYAVRYDPTKPIDWYFEDGFPDQYKNIFTRNNLPSGVARLPDNVPTIEEQANESLAAAGATARVAFHEWNAPDVDGNPTNHTFGDIRYNMVRFLQTFNQQSSFAGVESSVIDPRNGMVISNDIVFSNFAIKDYYIARIDAYLQTIGASVGILNSWPANAQIPDPTDPTGVRQVNLDCNADFVGSAAPIVPATLLTNHDGLSSLYQKMQGYLYRPLASAGPLGPSDFIAQHQDATNPTQPDNDFFHAYFTYIPYLIYADPALNQYVTPEGGSNNTSGSDSIWQMISKETQFHALTSSIDHGVSPYDTSNPQDAINFSSNLKALSINHRNLQMAKSTLRYNAGVDVPIAYHDNVTDFAMQSVMQKDARHCIADSTGDGGYHWETAQEWQDSLVYTYWSQVFWHEFGHAMGLEHNFIASVDKNNFPTYSYKTQAYSADKNNNLVKTTETVTRPALYASSVMEYNAVPDRVFWGAGFGPYDKAAIGFIYSNNGSNPIPLGGTATVPASSTQQTQSGQYTNSYPWKDPLGFSADGKTERQFITCNEQHVKYTPLCRAGDLGVTPSEITANEIDNYEWQYAWRNFRTYHKFWDLSNYGDSIEEFITDQRRFLSLWSFDFGSSEISSKLQQLGVTLPANAPASQTYFQQLTDKFTDEMSAAGQLSAAFHEAVIQQSSGQRPYLTVFDNFFGDTTQQGIGLDKLFALQSFLALWPIDNYDPTQAQGVYAFAASPYGLSDSINGIANGTSYGTVAEQALQSMLGSFDSFAYYKETAVQEFTWDTHSVDFNMQNQSPTNQSIQDFAGSKVFWRVEDFLQYFQEIAIQNHFVTTIGDQPVDCSKGPYSSGICNYDPRIARGLPGESWYSSNTNEFRGPDGRRYIWIYIQDRNEWVIADRDRNVSTYQIMLQYNQDVIQGFDDGSLATAYNDLIEVKYFADYYQMAVNTSH